MSFHELKVRKAFRFFDLNENGLLTKEELAKSADIISSLGNTTEVEAEETRRQWSKWADIVFPEGPATEDIFYEQNKKHFAEKPDFIMSESAKTYEVTFDRIDTNKDGFISAVELLTYYKAFGYDDKSYVEKVFSAMDENHDGLISKEEFVHAFAEYWSDKPGFEFLYDPPKKKT